MAAKRACRVSDLGTHRGAVALTGSPNVFINGLRAHRQGDIWTTHIQPPWHVFPTLSRGSSTVFVNGKQLGRIDDPISCGAQVQTGSSNVFVGD